MFGGGGLTNENAYMLGKFARVALRTANIDYNGRFCMASAAAANVRAFGLDRGLPFPLEDICGADAVLLAGGNPAETMPPIMQYFDEQRRRGGQLIVVDPRRSATAKLASLHLQLTPGTDAALANGLLHVAIAQGLIDHDFIASRTVGFEPVRRVVASYWPDRVERITGVPARQIVAAAHILGEASTAMVLTGRGPEQQSHGVNNVLAFINLTLALGKAGKPSSRLRLSDRTRQRAGRSRARAKVRPASRLSPARRSAAPRGDRRRVGDRSAGLAEARPLRVRHVCGSSGTASAVSSCWRRTSSSPRLTAAQLGERLRGLDLLVVADLFLSETAAHADVVLPVAQWAEDEGTMTNLEGRVLLRRRVKPPPEGVWTDAQILAALADRLGSGRHFSADPRAIFEEFRRATAGGAADYAGITYDRIVREDGVFWPCPAESHPGSRRLFHERFATADGRARFHPVEHEPAAEVPDAAYPYFLTTGRVLAQYQSGAQTRRVPELADAEPEAFVEIHPETARGLAIAEGIWCG